MPPVEPENAAAAHALQAHHHDPFDRILLAQARIEPMFLVSHDEKVMRYSDTIIRCRAPPASLHRHALRQIARLVHIGTLHQRRVIGQQLQRNHVQHG